MTNLIGNFLLQELRKIPPSLLTSSAKASVILSQFVVRLASGPVIEIVVPMTIGSEHEFSFATALPCPAATARTPASNDRVMVRMFPSLVRRPAYRRGAVPFTAAFASMFCDQCF